ncbi:hypothetical protein [Planococcus halocryophilus]|uniref:Helix-turn-helix domain containing protein n=1 Tax=Planococcus halocryophilus TaxID=1215089 RepID=A0A1C7DQL2_9BACL|nr:hypothetical protein [Planococcus halocryophilus]ANU13483.1 hypothetical protein BBI08_06335 [Planococcus halocryophilus]
MNYFLFEADDHDLNLIFSEEELEVFRELWSENISVRGIAEKMSRKTSEVALLVFDHAERGLIKQRDRSLHRL